MSKPVDERVAEKIATLFDDEERGYIYLSLVQGQEKVAEQSEPLFDPEICFEAQKLATEDPGALAEIYEKTCNDLSPEMVQAVEKQAAMDVQALVEQDAAFKKNAFMQGIYQYEGFKYAAANDQTVKEASRTAQTLSEKAPRLARAAGITR